MYNKIKGNAGSVLYLRQQNWIESAFAGRQALITLIERINTDQYKSAQSVSSVFYQILQIKVQ